MIFDQTQTCIQKTDIIIPSQPAKQSSLNFISMALIQISDVPFEIELKAVNESLKNNKGDEIDYYHRSQAFILFYLYFGHNFSSRTLFSIS